jgi:aspartate aminotransferase
MSFSKRVLSIQASATVAAFARAGELKRQGVDLISLVAGEPDFDTPEHIREAGIAAIRSGKTKYTNPASGIPPLKEVICRKLLCDNGLTYAPDQIIVTCGAKQTIFDAIIVLIDDGDEVIIPSPFWTSYADQVRLMGGHPVVVDTDPDRGFCMTGPQLRAALTDRTKMVMFNSPCNPTGGVYSRSELQDLANILVESGVYVISDEIYEKLLYDGAEHVSIAGLHPELIDKTLTVNGVSKAYAMTGWRVGYGAGPRDLISHMIKVQSQETTNTCSISQYAALAALDGPQDCVEEMRKAFEARRNHFIEGLNTLPGFTCPVPRGAFYAFPDVTGAFGKSSRWGAVSTDVDLCNFLLDVARVACVPGAGFGTSGYLRFSYAASSSELNEALDRMYTALTQLK